MDANELWSRVRKAGLKGPEEVRLPTKVPPVFEVGSGSCGSREDEVGHPYPSIMIVVPKDCLMLRVDQTCFMWADGEFLGFHAWMWVVPGKNDCVVAGHGVVLRKQGKWEFGTDDGDAWIRVFDNGWGSRINENNITTVSYLLDAALSVLGAINAPTNHVVRIDPKDARWKSDRTPPLEKLPRHILLQRKDVEKRWKTSHAGTGKTVMPHFRRGHWRVLRDEMYKQRQGEKVWVRPTKVREPDVDWSESGQRYTVIA